MHGGVSIGERNSTCRTNGTMRGDCNAGKKEQEMQNGAMEQATKDGNATPHLDDGMAHGCGNNGGGKERWPFVRQPLVWVDCEMTGLDVEKDQIIEIAVIITDGACAKIIEGPTYIIHADNSLLDSMSDWCRDTHGSSGLTEASRNSKITLEKAEEDIIAFVQKHILDLKSTPLAGNSVHVDRQFLLKQMPRFANSLSYRVVDVSSIKELWYRWRPNSPAFRHVPHDHRALEDIRGSIKELQYYKDNFFSAETAEKREA